MLTENDIVSFLTIHLKSAGYKILQSRQTHQQGVDIIADNNKQVVH
jgi:Holliday junction resolvase-like predicted endonuclease